MHLMLPKVGVNYETREKVKTQHKGRKWES